jgi:hypothetical protein
VIFGDTPPPQECHVLFECPHRRLILVSGFKAHTVHKKCLESYNETLSFAFNESGRELAIPENGILSWINFDGETVTATLPRCNLEEELDNVRCCPEFLIFQFYKREDSPKSFFRLDVENIARINTTE